MDQIDEMARKLKRAETRLYGVGENRELDY